MSVRPLCLEVLEDRRVPATFGIPWHDPRHLSLSFAPDGTGIVAHESKLEQSLDAQFARAAWQRTILEAFQRWAVHGNLDFGVRPDGGQAFGTPGLTQGDPRFGDVRVGAHDMTAEALAVAVPPGPSLSGTWSGDVLFNSASRFTGNPYSLLAVAMHEAGHALGLANSNDPASIMYSLYNATRTTLSAEDVARIQALYGVRAPDAYEGAGGNDAFARASPFLPPADYKGETPLVAFADVTTAADVDYYSFRSPDDGNDDQFDRSVTIRLQTAGVSLLAPKLTVLDANGRVLKSLASSGFTGDVLEVHLDGTSARQTYYLKVEGATQDVFGVGRYGLSVRFDKTSSTSDRVIEQLLSGPFDALGPDAIDAFFRNSGDVLLNAEEGHNETPSSAQPLAATAGYGGTRFEAVASLAKKEDVDVYSLSAPSGAARVLTATAWTTNTKGFAPSVAVLDAAGRAVPATVLVNGNGTSTVQLTAQPGATYYLKVGLGPQANEDKGNYFVSATFGEQQAPLRTFAEGTLSRSDQEAGSRLYVGQTQLFHFVLTAGNEDPGASVRMRIVNGAGAEVFALSARSGETVSAGSVLLTPGAYTVLFEIDNPNGAPLTYRLRGSSTTDPIGPVPLDPTAAPQYTSPLYPGTFLYPGFSITYAPESLVGFIDPNDPTTWPSGFVPPPGYEIYPWLLGTSDPYYWIPLGW